MATINRRIAASIEGDFVVFIIGARFNRWWKLPRYLWFLVHHVKDVAEVAADPKSGFLGWEPLSLTTNVQYWRSFEHLTAYSRNRDQTHYPYWVKFNKEIGSNGDIGIWHETFLVRAGEYECIYNNMPLRGLAKAAKHIDAQEPHAALWDDWGARMAATLRLPPIEPSTVTRRLSAHASHDKRRRVDQGQKGPDPSDIEAVASSTEQSCELSFAVDLRRWLATGRSRERRRHRPNP